MSEDKCNNSNNKSNVPCLDTPDFKPSIPTYMMDKIKDDTSRFLLEQLSVIKQQNKWQAGHLQEIYNYTRTINGKVIELEEWRSEKLVNEKIREEIKKRSVMKKKYFWPAIGFVSFCLYPIYIGLFLKSKGTGVINELLKLVS